MSCHVSKDWYTHESLCMHHSPKQGLKKVSHTQMSTEEAKNTTVARGNSGSAARQRVTAQACVPNLTREHCGHAQKYHTQMSTEEAKNAARQRVTRSTARACVPNLTRGSTAVTQQGGPGIHLETETQEQEQSQGNPEETETQCSDV